MEHIKNIELNLSIELQPIDTRSPHKYETQKDTISIRMNLSEIKCVSLGDQFTSMPM